jgi:ribose 5-phosphate isomerase B
MIIITSDHAGYRLKEKLKKFLTKKGFNYIDNGSNSAEPTDYPDFAKSASKLVLQDKKIKGIFICGSGVGMSITANKIAGIRAANAHSAKEAKLAVEHNNINVLTMGERSVNYNKAKKIVEGFLQANFKGGRHARRVEKIEN